MIGKIIIYLAIFNSVLAIFSYMGMYGEISQLSTPDPYGMTITNDTGIHHYNITGLNPFDIVGGIVVSVIGSTVITFAGISLISGLFGLQLSSGLIIGYSLLFGVFAGLYTNVASTMLRIGNEVGKYSPVVLWFFIIFSFCFAIQIITLVIQMASGVYWRFVGQ